MSLWRQLTRGLRALANRTAADQDVSDEVQDFLEQAAAEHIARGLSPADARRAAQLESGNAMLLREQVRSYGWENLVETFFSDLRYAARRLRRNPGFAALTALTLALGIGATTAIFSAVNPILFEPLPYPRPNRILIVWDVFQGARSDVTFHTYREIAERNHSFDALAVLEPWQPTMTGPTEPERLDGQSVSSGYFRALGVGPALGRDFEPADDAFHGARVAILSYKLWQRRFGGDAAIIGQQANLDGDAYTIVGVLPRGFDNVLAPTTEIWSPERYDPGNITDTNSAEWGHHLRMVGRLRPGVTLAQAKSDIDGIARTPVAEFPRPRWAALRYGFIVDSLQDDVTRGVKPALLAVLGAVILLLLIACVNVTNLLLARGAQRRGEFAMRAALGAGRGRMARQLLTESLLLAAIGGILGMIVAEFGVRALVAVSPAGLPRVGAIRVDGAVLAFGLGITTLLGLAVGLVPALHVSRSDLWSGLQQASRAMIGGHQTTRRTLVVAEVALALVLLVSAGLLLRSIERLFAVPPGFDASSLLTLQVQTSGHKFDDPKVTRQFFAQALEETRHFPGVESAAFTSLLPLTDDTQFGVYGAQFEKDNNSYDTFRYVVTPGYFETMRIPLRHGRYLDAGDVAGAPHAVVISESLAKQEFGDQDPIGQHVRVGGRPSWPWYTIVGVVADIRQASLAASNLDAAYITPDQSWFADQAMSLVVRARGGAAALAPGIRKAIWSVDKDQPIVRVATADDLLSASTADRQFVLILFEVFSIVALALAAIGIHGILAGSVTERTREIGVRSALGATPANIFALVLRQGMMLTGAGVVIGLAGAVAASQAIITLLFGVSHLDLITYLGVVALLLGVAVMACWAPAWRAARIDPASTLRAE